MCTAAVGIRKKKQLLPLQYVQQLLIVQQNKDIFSSARAFLLFHFSWKGRTSPIGSFLLEGFFCTYWCKIPGRAVSSSSKVVRPLLIPGINFNKSKQMENFTVIGRVHDDASLFCRGHSLVLVVGLRINLAYISDSDTYTSKSFCSEVSPVACEIRRQVLQ